MWYKWGDAKGEAREGRKPVTKSDRRTGRRPGESGSRAKILSAARAEFALHGYSGATIRAIAKRAGCDAALVHHFFGTKERLFGEVMVIPEARDYLPDILTDPEHAGELIVRRFLETWEGGTNSRQIILGLLRTAVSGERSASRVREMAMRASLLPIIDATHIPDGALRTGLIGSHLVGLMITRHIIRLDGVAAASVDELVEAVAPTVQRYLYGDISREKRRSETDST